MFDVDVRFGKLIRTQTLYSGPKVCPPIMNSLFKMDTIYDAPKI